MITMQTTLERETACDQQTTLDQLRPGQTGKIVRIDGVDGIASRLREMGFVPGQTVQYLRRAPLGDPVKCSVQGSRIAVRCGEARRVFIERTA